MASLYEIDRQISECLIVDEETGEVTFNDEAFDALIMERRDKLESLALYEKNLLSDAEAIDKEIKSLDKRKKTAEKKAERLRQLLTTALNGEKFSTPKVSISFRTSQSVKVTNISAIPPIYLREEMPTADLTAIGKALKNGIPINGAELETHLNISIK